MVSKDTLTVQENENLVQEMLRNAKGVELPSELSVNPVVHKGDATQPAPMTVKELSSAGYVYVWDTRSFERIPILYYMLPSKLRQRREDGSFRFTTTDPKQMPKRGNVHCMLHSDNENRKHYDELGFRVCQKENIRNAYELTRHMQLKHSKEWATIEQERIKKEREEDRQLQRLLIQGQLGRQDQVADKSSKPPIDSPLSKVELTGQIFHCDVCSKDFTTRIALAGHRRTHVDK